MIKRGIVLVIAVLFLLSYVSAVGDSCVTAEVSDITPSSIEVNEEFTVGVQIENCGTESPEFVSFELVSVPADLEIQESKIINISNLNYGNSERFLIYHMKTTSDARPGTYLIKTRLVYGKEEVLFTKEYNISIDIIGDEAELSIASFKTDPVLPRKGDTVELTLRIENTGDGTAESVEVNVDHPFEGLKQSFIGSLDSDEDGPAVLTFIVNKKGDFEFPVRISYEDDFGEKEVETNVSFNVLRKESNLGLILFVMFMIGVFGWGIYYFVKTKKEKDKTIHQLLTRNGPKDKEVDNIANKNKVIKKNEDRKVTPVVKKRNLGKAEQLVKEIEDAKKKIVKNKNKK